MIYEYKCNNCGHTFEENKKVDERDEPCKKPCEKCEANNSIEKVIGATPSSWKCERSTL